MKLNGQRIDMPAAVIIPIIRDDKEIFFKAGAVLDFAEFDSVCPMPKPPMLQRKGDSAPTADITDKKYQDNCDKYARQRTCYMIIKSLSFTENLEWEKVKLNDPSTYELYEQELKESGLNQFELTRIINGVMEANGLDDSKIEEARKRFLASKAAQA